MATVTLTLTDAPNGAVAIHSSFKPRIGLPCSPAQGHALEIINRTQKTWDAQPTSFCECSHDLDIAELQTGQCCTCGKAVLS